MFFYGIMACKGDYPECIGDVFVFLCDDYLKCFSTEY